MHQLVQDIRFALRQLRKAPGFTITAVLTLALGIGANASIFTLVHAVLLRNLPVVDPNSLVRVGDTDDCCVEGGMPKDNDYSIFAYDAYKSMQAAAPEFEQLAAVQAGYGTGGLTVRSYQPNALPKALSGEFVSGNYFTMLGLQPIAGRLLSPSDEAENAAPVAVMSYQAWERDFARDPAVVGSTFTVNTQPVTVVGITPPGFYGDRMDDTPRDFFLPVTMEPTLGVNKLLHRHGTNWLYLLGRVKPGTDRAALQAKLSGNLRQFLAELKIYQSPAGKKELEKTHLVLTQGGIGIANMQMNVGSGLKLLMAISALVLLIACANIANLVLVRGMGRRAETSIRMALGAERKRIIRQMLTESVVLSCIGGAAGLAVAYAGTRTLLSLAFPMQRGLPINPSPSLPVLGFAFGLSLLTGLLFGVAPAWITSHSEPAEALRGANRSTRDSSSWVQRGLVVFQAALSLVLLVGAGLLTKSLNNLETQNLGLEPHNRVVIHLSPENAGYKATELPALYDEIVHRFEALPGVEHAALTSYTPQEGDNWGEGVVIQGHPEPGIHDNINASWTRVGPELFTIIGAHMIAGRNINEHDTATSPLVAVVNQSFVKKFFHNGENPIGAHFGTGGVSSAGEIEIVGVVSDAKFQDPHGAVRAMYFRPLTQRAQLSDGPSEWTLFAGAIMLETKGRIDNLESQTRQTLASIGPNLTVVKFDTFEHQISLQLTQDRLVSRLTLLFGVLALVLAAVGLYGVTAYMVARRTSEIGIRMALGADRMRVVRMVMREALLQAAVGLAVGVPVALLCARFVKTQLYQVNGHDMSVLLLATLALGVAAFVAGFVPARRAASTDPMSALRTE